MNQLVKCVISGSLHHILIVCWSIKDLMLVTVQMNGWPIQQIAYIYHITYAMLEYEEI